VPYRTSGPAPPADLSSANLLNLTSFDITDPPTCKLFVLYKWAVRILRTTVTAGSR
jgi:hypothetical protein